MPMTSSLRLARIAGIEIRAHWSLLVVVALIVWSLADSVFPDSNPGLSTTAYLVMASAAALLFGASIALHELGHALQAQRDGVAVQGITLWVFGGVAELRGNMPSAGAELRIAAAGPAVSLVLAGICLGLAIAVPLPAEVDGVAFWLGQINLSLLLFNLIPALPLDGGRMLRALLWMWRDDQFWATRVSGALGRGFGQLMIAGGLVLAIFGATFSGVWFVFLGWFLLAAAEAELSHSTARSALADLTVADLEVRHPVSVRATASVKSFMDDVFMPTRHTAFPVTDGNEAVGLVSFRDALDVPAERWQGVQVAAIMTSAREVTIAADTPLADALPRLTNGLRRLLVDDGGLLSATDVMRVVEVRTRVPVPASDRAAPAVATGRPQTIGR
jgi:Zn-dependent protease